VQLAAVNLLVTIVSGADNFNANPLLQYILAIPMTTFVPLIRLPAAASTLTDAHQQPPREGMVRISYLLIHNNSWYPNRYSQDNRRSYRSANELSKVRTPQSAARTAVGSADVE
jgi:hypothetical protein